MAVTYEIADGVVFFLSLVHVCRNVGLYMPL